VAGGVCLDGVAESFEASDVAAGAAGGVGQALLVVARAEFLVLGSGTDRRWRAMTAWVLMSAPRAFFFGIRLHMRRYLAPRKVSVRPAAAAVSPRVPPAQGLPRPVAFLPFRLPADSLTPGAVRSHEHRCPGGREDGHIDADLGDQVLGRGDAKPRDAVELGDLPLVRLAHDRDLLIQHGDAGGEAVDALQHHLQDERVVLGEELAVQGLFQLRAISASTRGSRSPAMIAVSMSRPETPWMSLITDDSFRCPSSRSFSQRSFSAARIWVSLRR
jgi:hypothetical protein